jgi:hypothetical protein
VISRRFAGIFLKIDRSLVKLGRRCCVIGSQRRLDRAKLKGG